VPRYASPTAGRHDAGAPRPSRCRSDGVISLPRAFAIHFAFAIHKVPFVSIQILPRNFMGRAPNRRLLGVVLECLVLLPVGVIPLYERDILLLRVLGAGPLDLRSVVN